MPVRSNYFNLMGLLLAVLFSTNAFASDSEEFKFPNETVVENEKLILNGQAIRKVTIFSIKVMMVGLYLKTKSDNSEQILLSKTSKQIQIRFLRNIASEKISGMLREQLAKKCLRECIALKSKADHLGQMMIDFKAGDSLTFIFSNEEVKVLANNNASGTIQGKHFSNALLSLWIGDNPIDDSLRRGLLGAF